MSQILEPLDGRSIRFAALDGDDCGTREQSSDDLTRLYVQVLMDIVAESVVFFSVPTSRLLCANRAAANCLGYSQQQLQDMSLWDIAPHATRENVADLCRRVTRSADGMARVRTVYRHRSGALVPVQCTIRSLRTGPENILVAVARDVCRRNDMKPRLLGETFRDSLTLLPNRAWLWRQLDREILAAQRSEYQFAVLFIDIDRFKEINDSHGHLTGDDVLQAVARRLMASIRPHDAIARYGGDEFVVIMKDIRGGEEIRRIAERIGGSLETVGKRRGGNEWRVCVTVSIGAAICEGRGSSAVDAIERADRAMYRAKSLGRNGRFVIDELRKDSGQPIGVGAEFADPTRQFE